jgi:hypothetical protein
MAVSLKWLNQLLKGRQLEGSPLTPELSPRPLGQHEALLSCWGILLEGSVLLFFCLSVSSPVRILCDLVRPLSGAEVVHLSTIDFASGSSTNLTPAGRPAGSTRHSVREAPRGRPSSRSPRLESGTGPGGPRVPGAHIPGGGGRGGLPGRSLQ